MRISYGKTRPWRLLFLSVDDSNFNAEFPERVSVNKQRWEDRSFVTAYASWLRETRRCQIDTNTKVLGGSLTM